MTVLLPLVLVGSVKAAMALGAAIGEPPKAVGFVLEASCEWQLNPPEGIKVAVGIAVPEDAVIQLARVTDPACAIVVAFFDDSVQRYDCAAGVDCSRAVVISKQGEATPSAAARVFEAVRRLYAKEPTRYAAALSRGMRPRNGVARSTDRGLDLSESLAPVPPGLYVLSLRRLDDDLEREHGLTLDPVPYYWDPIEPIPVTTAHLPSGLYEMTIAQARPAEQGGDLGSAWILLEPTPRFEKDHAQYSRARSFLEGLDASIEMVTRTALERCYLAYLAELAAGRY